MLEDFVPKYNRRDIADYIKLSKMESILCGSDCKIWMLLNEITNEKEYEFDSAFEIVFDWCCEILERANRYE